MGKSIKSELIGMFIFNETFHTYEQNEGKVHWGLDIGNESVHVHEMMKRAEKLYICLDEFDRKAKVAIAEELIEYKNDFWPEYDENDEQLDWDAVDAGEYDMTKETFEKSITLMDIVMRENDIYCEYDDGDLFGGHRIHASFDYEYNLLDAGI
ncbi:DUF2262 domain-containing protein [Bacillus mobilis]|uniref:DUF2262 domain-containing protein n=1 Tax=Bacillus mobilis TaxID=2026190 RepID=UPI002E1E2F0D|nr:DUF2262 domain-containing protein [Bacillus mobilis]MED0932271.1 DUF2262 domain-containing protein [Bacillus mobilis]MED0954944.1 DUF2262 domain-containing protein [Bacillus mobilis]